MILLTPRQVKIYTWNVKRIEIDRAIYFLEGYTRLLRYPRFHLIHFSFSLIGLGVFTFSRSVHQWFGWVVGGLSRLWDSCSQRLSRLSSPRCSPGLWTPYRWGYSWPRGVAETATHTAHLPAILATIKVCLWGFFPCCPCIIGKTQSLWQSMWLIPSWQKSVRRPGGVGSKSLTPSWTFSVITFLASLKTSLMSWVQFQGVLMAWWDAWHGQLQGW